MATITLTKKNVFSRMSKLIGLLDHYDSIKVKYDLPVDDDPDRINVTVKNRIAHKQAVQNLASGNTLSLDQVRKQLGFTK